MLYMVLGYIFSLGKTFEGLEHRILGWKVLI